MNKFQLTLDNLTSKATILDKIGQQLGYTDGQRWGKNWSALNDILRYLEDGGIYGKNEIIALPVTFEVSNWKAFKEAAPDDFQILVDIFESTRNFYEGRVEFEFIKN